MPDKIHLVSNVFSHSPLPSIHRYAANIEKIDYEDEKVLIHYRQWSHRYDEWFDWASPYLRPVERVQLRRQGLQDEAGSSVRPDSADQVSLCFVFLIYYSTHC